ncbi:hypothetical protein TCE0_017r03908 [Talaromyces pinophilus]|uniref:Uncharacterized protein n=1 Tax=Talaromyces pinophilus TaxID=128442 RepID=A0A6V8H7J1_TALPI|nr:hypothetical protein TCE0_017r03908 [Talaromyces pinophilus]
MHETLYALWGIGGFMSVLAWKPCCFKCLQEAPETHMQTLAATRKQLHLTKAESSRLRSFKAPPGVYSMSEYVRNSLVAIVSVPQAIPVCARLPQGPAQTQFRNSQRNQKFNFMGACALPYYDKQTGEVDHGMSCAGCQLALEKSIIATRAEESVFEARDKIYARDGFLGHFKWLGTRILYPSFDHWVVFDVGFPAFWALLEFHFLLSPHLTGPDQRRLKNVYLKPNIGWWHNTRIDGLELEKTKQLTAMAFEAMPHSNTGTSPLSIATVIAKMARFEWEIPRIEQETRAYQLLEASELAPRFLGHVHENDAS